MKVYLIFHISLLEPTSNAESSQDESTEEEWEVERILAKKLENGRIKYFWDKSLEERGIVKGTLKQSNLKTTERGRSRDKRHNKGCDNQGTKRQEDGSINRPDYLTMYLVYRVLFSYQI